MSVLAELRRVFGRMLKRGHDREMLRIHAPLVFASVVHVGARRNRKSADVLSRPTMGENRLPFATKTKTTVPGGDETPRPLDAPGRFVFLAESGKALDWLEPHPPTLRTGTTRTTITCAGWVPGWVRRDRAFGVPRDFDILGPVAAFKMVGYGFRFRRRKAWRFEPSPAHFFNGFDSLRFTVTYLSRFVFLVSAPTGVGTDSDSSGIVSVMGARSPRPNSPAERAARR